MAMNVKDFKIEIVDIDVLKHLPDNANTMEPGQMSDLGDEMEEYGVLENIVVNKRTMHIVGGNHRVYVLQQRGETQAPVRFVDLDEKNELKLSLALNKFKGKFDPDKLRDVLLKLDGDYTFTGFSEKELLDLKLDDITDIKAPTMEQLNEWVRFSFGEVEGDVPREVYENFLSEMERMKKILYPKEKPDQVSIVKPLEYIIASSAATPAESLK